MEVTISGRHVAVTDAMRERARERAQRFEEFSRNVMRLKVTLTIEGERHMAEFIATVRRKGEVVARGESHDMYLSIDQAVAKLEKQLHRLEERIKLRRQGGRKRSLKGGTVAPDTAQDSADDDADVEENE